VDGNGGGQSTSSKCLYGQGGLSEIRIDRVRFVNCKNQGIFLDGAAEAKNSGIEITNYRISDVGSHGILTHHGHDVSVLDGVVERWALEFENRPAITVGRPGSRAIVSRNFIRDAGGPNAGGISIDNLNGGVVSGNFIENVTSWGIEVVDLSLDIAVTGNAIRSPATQGIAIQGNVNGAPQRVTVTGNLIRSAGDTGIRSTKGLSSYGPVQITITGNSIYNSAGRGIWIVNSREITVVSNVSRINGAAGLEMQNSTSYVVSANILTGNGQPSLY
jgi:parallel beta-helix repeat protein